MKSIDLYITESDNSSKLGSKLDKILDKTQNKLSELIASREKNWDANKFSWSREPMFLIIDAHYDDFGGERFKSWQRWIFIKGHKEEIKGTFKDYNVKNDKGMKPNSVIGIYYDRKFKFITSLNTFYELYDLLESEYENK